MQGLAISNRSEAENEYARALVAVDAKTGEDVSYFQTVYNDVWDYDLGSQPSLGNFPAADEPCPRCCRNRATSTSSTGPPASRCSRWMSARCRPRGLSVAGAALLNLSHSLSPHFVRLGASPPSATREGECRGIDHETSQVTPRSWGLIRERGDFGVEPVKQGLYFEGDLLAERPDCGTGEAIGQCDRP